MTAEQKQTPRFDVAIVGYGPTGATLANLLAQSGVSVAVIEREAEMYHLPRAVHFDGETMRVFQTVGIADDLRVKVRVNPGMRFVDSDGHLLVDWPRPQEVGPNGWHASYRLHQPDLETLLREKLRCYGKASVFAQSDVVALEDLGNEVLVTYQDRTSDQSHQLIAGFVVGCDGARSFVRNTIASGMQDLGFDERWLVIDVLLKRPRPDLGDHSVQFCNSERPMTYCRSPGSRRRWEITVLPYETDEDVTSPRRIWDFLSQWITSEDAELERSAVYTFRSAVASIWRKGRLLVAGDAAHLTPPFMGQGMCAGIRDAANLGWKLAMCVKGDAEIALLDSYQAERAPHAQAFIETAVRLGGLINTLDRQRALDMANSQAGDVKMQTISPRLGPSEIRLASQHFGQLFTQTVLTDGTRMDDAVGYAPVLVTRTARQSKMQTLNTKDEPSLAVVLDALAVDAVLIRPDRYIQASAQTEADIKVLADFDFSTSSNAAFESELGQ